MSDEERPDADALPEAEKSIRRRPSRLLRRLLSVLLVILLLPVVLLARRTLDTLPSDTGTANCACAIRTFSATAGTAQQPALFFQHIRH